MQDIAPPSEESFNSHDDAEAALYQWTRAHSFNVSRRRAYRGESDAVFQRNYECDRAGKPKSTGHLTDAERQRPLRGSKRIGCPMKIILRAVDRRCPDGPWQIVRARNGSAQHNHPPSQDVRVHAAHRRRAAGEIALAAQDFGSLIAAQTGAGVSVERIHASVLLQDPDALVTDKDIANAKASKRQAELQSMTVVEALFNQLRLNDFFFTYDVNPLSSRLRYLFWAHPHTTKLYSFFPDVLVLDCTYKTNEYDLPLLNIVAITAMNTVLPVAQCWLPGEKEEDFAWAFHQLKLLIHQEGVPTLTVILTDRDLACLNALDAAFPNIPSMVCRWHMNRNVLARTRLELGQELIINPGPFEEKYRNTEDTDNFMNVYYDAVGSDNEAKFEAKRLELAKLSQSLSAYLDLHWWRYKQRVVQCWTNNNLHFGNQDTSTVEGTHAHIKRRIQPSKGDLSTVFHKLLPWWKRAARRISLQAERNVTITPALLNVSRYSSAVRVISSYALIATDKLWREAIQIVRSKATTQPCSGVFRRVNGRPCLHELIKLVEDRGASVLTPDYFHAHWSIRSNGISQQSPRILEPAVLVKKKRPKTSGPTHRRNHGQRGTAREPTFGERVDRNDPASAPAPPAPTVLPPLASVVLGMSRETEPIDDQPFHGNFLPPRPWGYAGRGSL